MTQWGDGRRLGYADSVLRHYDCLRGPRPDQQSAVSTPPMDGEQDRRVAEIFQEIQATNQLQSLAQGFQPGASAPAPAAQPFAPRSYAQLAGIDRSGASQHDPSWAGVLGAGDDSN